MIPVQCWLILPCFYYILIYYKIFLARIYNLSQERQKDNLNSTRKTPRLNFISMLKGSRWSSTIHIKYDLIIFSIIQTFCFTSMWSVHGSLIYYKLVARIAPKCLQDVISYKFSRWSSTIHVKYDWIIIGMVTTARCCHIWKAASIKNMMVLVATRLHITSHIRYMSLRNILQKVRHIHVERLSTLFNAVHCIICWQLRSDEYH